MDYTVVLSDIEKKIKKKIKNILIQWQSEGKFSSWESLQKTFEDEDISTIDELIETIAINPTFFWECLEHGLSYYIRDAKLLFFQDNKRTAMTKKEIDNLKTFLRIFINREYATEEEAEDLFREEKETGHLDYKTWGKFLWFLDRNTYYTIVRAEVKKFVINDPTINKIYEGGEVELSDEEYDEGFDESLKIKHKRRLKY